MRDHGGALHLEDSDLGGLRVRVELPHDTGLATTSSAPAPAPRTVTPEPLTLLVVDDERGIRRAYVRLLRPHRVHAMDATEALAWLDEPGNASAVDAVVCDVMMPGLDGRAFFEAATARHARLARRFVFCSGGVFKPELQRFLDANGGVPVLTKPVNRDGLMHAIERVLEASAPATRP